MHRQKLECDGLDSLIFDLDPGCKFNSDYVIIPAPRGGGLKCNGGKNARRTGTQGIKQTLGGIMNRVYLWNRRLNVTFRAVNGIVLSV